MGNKVTAQENFEKVRQELLDNCNVTLVERKLGGQQTSVIHHLVSIKSKDMDVEIICGHSSSIVKNTDLARLMMKRAIETIIK